MLDCWRNLLDVCYKFCKIWEQLQSSKYWSEVFPNYRETFADIKIILLTNKTVCIRILYKKPCISTTFVGSAYTTSIPTTFLGMARWISASILTTCVEMAVPTKHCKIYHCRPVRQGFWDALHYKPSGKSFLSLASHNTGRTGLQ